MTTTLSTPRVRTPWGAILSLGLGTAVLVTSEFLPAGVLTRIAAELHVTPGVAGWSVAATAIAGAVTAPTIPLLLPRADRRLVLIGLLVLGAVSDVVVALTPNFALLLVARLLLGMAVAGFWSFSFGVGVHAAPTRARTVSTVNSLGVSVATIVGVPVSSLVGDVLEWRLAFAGTAVLCLVAALVLALTVPSTPAHPAAGLRMLAAALRNRLLVAGVGAVGLTALASFLAYPFIRLAIERVAPDGSAWLLLIWGLGGLVGNLIAGFAVRRLRLLAAIAPVVLAAALAGTIAAPSPGVLVAAIALWGVAFNTVPVFATLWVTRAEPEHAESAMSLNVTAFQIAITIGAAVGGALLDAQGLVAPFGVAVVVALLAGALFAVLRLPRR